MNGHIHAITPPTPSKTTNYVRLKQETGLGGAVGGYYFLADKPVASRLTISAKSGSGSLRQVATIQQNATRSTSFVMYSPTDMFTVSPTEDSTYKYQIVQVIS